MTAYRLLALLSLLLLGACSSTEFVNLPDGEVKACDERLIGHWKVVTISDSGEQDEPDYLSIEADCKRFVGASPGKDGKEPETEDLQNDTEISFVLTNRANFVATRERRDNPESGPSEQQTFTLYRYEIKKDQVSLYGTDHERVGDLIRAGKLHGRTVLNAPNSGSRTTQNQVESAGDELTRALRDRKFFEKKPTLKLERISKESLSKAFFRVKKQGQSSD